MECELYRTKVHYRSFEPRVSMRRPGGPQDLVSTRSDPMATRHAYGTDISIGRGEAWMALETSSFMFPSEVARALPGNRFFHMSLKPLGAKLARRDLPKADIHIARCSRVTFGCGQIFHIGRPTPLHAPRDVSFSGWRLSVCVVREYVSEDIANIVVGSCQCLCLGDDCRVPPATPIISGDCALEMCSASLTHLAPDSTGGKKPCPGYACAPR